jgi:hypothetical protein
MMASEPFLITEVTRARAAETCDLLPLMRSTVVDTSMKAGIPDGAPDVGLRPTLKLSVPFFSSLAPDCCWILRITWHQSAA